MERYVEKLIDELRTLIADLGKDGGLFSPSLYDTAQVLRLYPPAQGVRPGLAWLMAQQQADGGWGDRSVPLARDIPTLAAVLALHTYCRNRDMRRAVNAGIQFLHRQEGQWQAPLPDDIPIAAELILPRLVQEAVASGLDISPDPYAVLGELGERKRQIIAKLDPRAGSPLAYSWEAWGEEPHADLVDSLGSVCNSPAATAAWLRAAEGRADLAEQIAKADQYLSDASGMLASDVPGQSPTLWPVNRFEQVFVLHTLMLSGLLGHDRLRGVIMSQLADLELALTPKGLGLSDGFQPDGDNTAAAVAALNAAGFRVSPDILLQFRRARHFCAYPKELQPSISVTARAVDALRLLKMDVSEWQHFLVNYQQADGRWLGDKWNVSWLYTTCVVLHTLRGAGYIDAKKAAWNALRTSQHADGGWGMGEESTLVETAYGLLSARSLMQEDLLDPNSLQAVSRAYNWLIRQYVGAKLDSHTRWLGKELYSAARIDRAFILSAAISVALEVSTSPHMSMESYIASLRRKRPRIRHRRVHRSQPASNIE